MKKEFLIYISILVILSIIFHSDQWINYPIDHLLNLKNSAAYGLGFFHPFIFTLIVYIILLIPRFIIKIIRKYK